MARAEDNTKGPGKRGETVEGHEVTKAWTNEMVVVTAQVKLPVPKRMQISERCRGVEEEVCVYSV